MSKITLENRNGAVLEIENPEDNTSSSTIDLSNIVGYDDSDVLKDTDTVSTVNSGNKILTESEVTGTITADNRLMRESDQVTLPTNVLVDEDVFGNISETNKLITQDDAVTKVTDNNKLITQADQSTLNLDGELVFNNGASGITYDAIVKWEFNDASDPVIGLGSNADGTFGFQFVKDTTYLGGIEYLSSYDVLKFTVKTFVNYYFRENSLMLVV